MRFMYNSKPLNCCCKNKEKKEKLQDPKLDLIGFEVIFSTEDYSSIP